MFAARRVPFNSTFFIIPGVRIAPRYLQFRAAGVPHFCALPRCPGAKNEKRAAEPQRLRCPLCMSQRFYQFLRSSPQKNTATVPGPVWLPIVAPMGKISGLPFIFGNSLAMWSATACASSSQTDWQRKHFPV